MNNTALENKCKHEITKHTCPFSKYNYLGENKNKWAIDKRSNINNIL